MVTKLWLIELKKPKLAETKSKAPKLEVPTMTKLELEHFPSQIKIKW